MINLINKNKIFYLCIEDVLYIEDGEHPLRKDKHVVVEFKQHIATIKLEIDDIDAKTLNTKLTAITRTAYTDDSIPTERPDNIVVAGPVFVESTISCTGFLAVAVK